MGKTKRANQIVPARVPITGATTARSSRRTTPTVRGQVSSGELLYAAPDKWVFRENEITTWQFNLSAKKFEQVRLDCGEHWACDGKSIYCVDHQQREVHATKLPPELRGRPITDGPFAVCLPFFFGRVHVRRRLRFWRRCRQTKGPVLYPNLDAARFARSSLARHPPEAAKGRLRFQRSQVILQMPDMLPRELRFLYTHRLRCLHF